MNVRNKGGNDGRKKKIMKYTGREDVKSEGN